jgi:hypothetical protein
MTTHLKSTARKLAISVPLFIVASLVSPANAALKEEECTKLKALMAEAASGFESRRGKAVSPKTPNEFLVTGSVAPLDNCTIKGTHLVCRLVEPVFHAVPVVNAPGSAKHLEKTVIDLTNGFASCLGATPSLVKKRGDPKHHGAATEYEWLWHVPGERLSAGKRPFFLYVFSRIGDDGSFMFEGENEFTVSVMLH